MSPKVTCIDPFCYKQFPLSFPSPSSKGSSAKLDVTAEEFEDVLNNYIHDEGYELREGYAPFCKHVFLPNVNKGKGGGPLTMGRVNTVEITDDNEDLIRTEYEARTEKEVRLGMGERGEGRGGHFDESSATSHL